MSGANTVPESSTTPNPLTAGTQSTLAQGSNSARTEAAGMSGTSASDGFHQAMLKTALDTIPQLTEENYSTWKDKMTALLDLRGVLDTLQSGAENSTLTTESQQKTEAQRNSSGRQ
ncbi:hypothetical protein PCANC_10001 [Puccinia coronata f. sp. avenae]|uniref:Uncharacterized protein n=1 Tax=Puccinia coronata f. sp. avenae TaxID=200324 RepID=A0A2N5T134_9BASI|nr:hypothetical protein PCANC_10001 [Puccinia coronata f. sp. avenae]